MQLRPYQQEQKEKILMALTKERRVMLQLPTGGGKTISFVDIANEFIQQEKRVWILVHRKELIDQTIDKIWRLGMQYSVIQSDYAYKHYVKLQIASVPTLVRRMDNVLPPDLIICDEAHHSPAETYRKIYENYPEAKILGVTATPIRTNGEGFKDLFDVLIPGPTINQLIELGFLVKTRIFANPLPFNLKKIKLTAGDYNEKALYNAFQENCLYGNLVKSWEKHATGKRTIVFAINIAHSQQIVKTFQDAGIPAEHVDGGTNKDDRRAILQRLKEGKTLVVSNVGIITEGFDCPAVECIQLVRPTKSLGLYLQMIGRGLRPFGDKEHAVILDHSNSVFTHGFPEQTRSWTLEGTQVKEPKVIVAVDRFTGKEYEVKDLPETIDDVELIELEMSAERISIMDALIQKAGKYNFKVGWAWFKFIEEVQIPTKFEIQRFANLAGYKNGWAKYKMEEFNIN